MAFCLHNVDEWVPCPAARPSPPFSIPIGNWALIEWSRDRKKTPKQQQKQTKTRGGTCWYLVDSTLKEATVSVFDDFGPHIYSSPFCIFTLWFPSLFRLSVIVLCWMPLPRFRFSVKIAFITTVLSVSNSFASFFSQPYLVSAGGSTSLEVKKHHYRKE